MRWLLPPLSFEKLRKPDQICGVAYAARNQNMKRVIPNLRDYSTLESINEIEEGF